jgi:hypothetical protein
LFIAFMLYRAFDSFNGKDVANTAQKLASSAASGAAVILSGKKGQIYFRHNNRRHAPFGA